MAVTGAVEFAVMTNGCGKFCVAPFCGDNTVMPCAAGFAVMRFTDEPNAPRLSHTVARTSYAPTLAYVWVAVGPFATAPSPKSICEPVTAPSGSRDPLVFTVTVIPPLVSTFIATTG